MGVVSPSPLKEESKLQYCLLLHQYSAAYGRRQHTAVVIYGLTDKEARIWGSRTLRQEDVCHLNL